MYDPVAHFTVQQPIAGVIIAFTNIPVYKTIDFSNIFLFATTRTGL
jgi:hypothetical protein